MGLTTVQRYCIACDSPPMAHDVHLRDTTLSGFTGTIMLISSLKINLVDFIRREMVPLWNVKFLPTYVAPQ